MAFIRGHEFIFENKLGIIFNFYLNEQKQIEYIASDEKRRWKEKELVFNQATESFHLDVDNKENIHIVSYNKDGCLYYHQYLGHEWVNHSIFCYPEEQRVMYPIIKQMNNQIHIFYYLLHNEPQNRAYLLHLKFHNEKYNANHIAIADNYEYINPFKIFINDDKNGMTLIYSSINKEHEQIFISEFDMPAEQWSEPLCVTSSKDKKIYVDGLLYNAKTLHLIWSRFDEEYLTVQYLKLDMGKILVGELKPVSLSSKSSCSFPVLIYYKNILWAMWTEMSKVVSCYSIDMGKNWSEPYIHENTKKVDFKRYRYIGSPINNKDNILCDYVFGTPYPSIQFLGFGGENNDEIPT